MNENENLGKNHACWCGSGKKYKRCHMPDAESKSKSPHERWRERLKPFESKHCQAPQNWESDCSGNIIKAHTVPKSSSLRKLARDGHVYGFKGGLDEMQRNQGQVVPTLIGVNLASTFTGFCSYHDNKIFSALEDQVFSATRHQSFLLAYRAVAREQYTKNAASITAGSVKESEKFPELSKNDIWDLISWGSAKGLADINRHKLIYDDLLKISDFSSSRYYLIKLNETPPIMCSGGIFPQFKWDGESLPNMRDIDAESDFLSYTSIATHYGGAVVFSWDRSSDKTCIEFIRSLNRIPSESLPELLVKFFFSVCENIMWSPEWWENLSDDEQGHLVGRFNEAINPLGSIPAADLLSGSIGVGTWKVTDKVTNAFF